MLCTSSHLVFEMLYLSSKEMSLQTEKLRNKCSVPLVTSEQKVTSLQILEGNTTNGKYGGSSQNREERKRVHILYQSDL